MKKKLMAILLAVAMLAALLAGCSSSNNNTGNNSGNNGTNDSEGTDEEYPVIRMAYSVVFPSPDEEAIEEELNKIMREKAHAEVDLVGVEFGNWATQLNLMLTGGGDNSLDLFNSFWYTSVSNLVSNGQVMALDDLLASDGTGITDLFSDGLEDYLKCGQVNGTQYGIPCMYAYCTENIYYARTEDAQAANIDWSQVTDLDSMSEAILAIKEANPDSYYIPGSTEPYWVPKSIDYLGDTNYLGVLTNPTESTTVENFYESDYFLTWMEYVKE